MVGLKHQGQRILRDLLMHTVSLNINMCCVTQFWWTGSGVQSWSVASSIMSTAGDHLRISSAEFSSDKRTRSDRVHGQDLSSQSNSELIVLGLRPWVHTASLQVFSVKISPQLSSGQLLLCHEISEKHYEDSHITQQKDRNILCLPYRKT